MKNATPVIQGDVILIPVDEAPDGVPVVEEEVILAHGENGHVHVIEKDAQWLKDAIAAINTEPGDTGLILVREAAEVRHRPETDGAKQDSHHDPVTLEPGTVYRVRQQREHAHYKKETLFLRD